MATTAPEIARETRLRMYRTMVECRYFEVRAQELFFEGLVRGTTHLGVGQEAVAAGVAAALRADDYTFCTYRGHNHTLARGVPMAPIFAELFGRGTGLLGGKGGSMHLTSIEHGVMGSYAIVGAHLPIALGAAWSAQYRESGQVAVCFFGDGATNIGAFHEALNMAAVWKAPVVFICENNKYMEYTAIGDVTAVERPAADRAPPTASRRSSSTATMSTPSSGWRPPRSSAPVPAKVRRSSRPSPTGMAATRERIRASTAPTTRSPPGRHVTRSPRTGRGWRPRASTAQRSTPSRRRPARRSRRRKPRHGPRRSRRPTCSRPRSGATGARHGGTDVPSGHRRRDRPGDAARPDRSS